MSATASNAQPAPERRAAEVQLRRMLATLTPTRRRLVGAVRRALRTRLPAANEIVYEYRDCRVVSYAPTHHGYEGVLAIRASQADVKLYFNHGKPLPDPERLLQGSGRQARWIALESAASLAQPAVARLIDLAIGGSPRRFDPDGQGWIIIQTKATKPSGGTPAQRGKGVGQRRKKA